MKKILLSAVLTASSWALFAQDTTNQQMTNQQMNSSTNQTTTTPQYNATTTSNYNAYGIPNYVQTNFQTQYPGVTNLTWTSPTADWYHGYYSDASGRYTHVYYSTDPYYNSKYYPERVTGYTVSLPVLQTYVPDAVITSATNMYKQNLYDITALKAKDSQEVYQVRVQDNGELKSMWMDASGTAVTDYWRIDQPMNNTTDLNSTNSTDTNAAMDSNSSMNNNATDMNSSNSKTKTKTKMSDGTIQKTKTKNGKTSTKTIGTTTNNQQL